MSVEQLVLADYLQASDFLDALLDAYIEFLVDLWDASGGPWRLFPGRKNIVLMYEQLNASPSLRKFMVDWCLQAWEMGDYQKDLTDWPAEFVRDLLHAAAPYITDAKKKGRKEYDVFDADRTCRYHAHMMEGGECCKVKYRRLNGL